MVTLGEAKLTSFLVKVASRCNLDCDYCYVYHHADQSWRSMPPILRQEDQDAFSAQLAKYVVHAGLRRCVVVFHGGEPLLMGSDQLVAFARQLRQSVGKQVELDISMQTNGLLLTREVLDALVGANIAISLSLDGPKEANDLHRTSRRGRSSFERTLRALELLKGSPEAFAGVIAVIDPRTSPRRLLEFFAEHAVPRLDFLLPDAHHFRPPPGRQDDARLYERWLIEAFDLWLDEFPSLEVRTFEALLDATVGMQSQTDAFGFGDVSLITVETDGTYHDLDVLKVVADGASRLTGNVRDTPIAEVARSPGLAAHRALLSKEGLCATCQQCDVVDVCGGGAVPHRHGMMGFRHPTVYCGEMLALIRHVRSRLTETLRDGYRKPPSSEATPFDFDVFAFERAEYSCGVMAELWSDAVASQSEDLRRALRSFDGAGGSLVGAATMQALEADVDIEALAQRPGTIAWSKTMIALDCGRPIVAVDGSPLHRDAGYIEWMGAARSTVGTDKLEVHVDDPWLRRPFGTAIHFESQAVLREAGPLLREAIAILEAWRPAVVRELRQICRAVQFVRDPAADPNKIVSFSDNAVPGALYVSVMQRDRLVDAYDLADSLLHEYRHQKLYLLERLRPVVDQTSHKVVSPWRDDLRPPSGLFHAIFVFVELRRFWRYVRSLNLERVNRRAENQLLDTDVHLREALTTLAECPLTPTGRALAVALQAAARE